MILRLSTRGFENFEYVRQNYNHIIKWAVVPLRMTIQSWDTVFFVKTLGQNIGIRVYYYINKTDCTITYDGQTREFGLTTTTYHNNPTKGDTATYTYEFKIVAGKPYTKQKDGKKLLCMQIKVDAIQNLEIKNQAGSTKTSEFLDDGKPHQTTISIEC